MPLHDLFIDAALLALSIAALAFATAGAMLCVRPPPPVSLPEGAETSRGILGLMESPRRIERFIYRHHHASGAVIMLGAGFYLWRMLGVGVIWQPEAFDYHLPMLWFLTIAIALAFMLGLVIFVRPSGLKPLESRANHWVGPQAGTLREWLNRHPRLRGSMILAVSLYGLLVFGSLLIERTARWWEPIT